jgi:general secretion pathway protein G
MFFGQKGFTLIELLVVIVILGIISGIVVSNVKHGRQQAYFTRTKCEMRSFHTALEMWMGMNGFSTYPADADRNIPPGLEEYLAGGDWPDAAWPGSVYDWDNWDDPDNPGQKIYQLSIRFCPLGQPSNCRFPEFDWAEDFDYYSSVYYCISGNCRSHISRSADHPGYCVNCAGEEE